MVVGAYAFWGKGRRSVGNPSDEASGSPDREKDQARSETLEKVRNIGR